VRVLVMVLMLVVTMDKIGMALIDGLENIIETRVLARVGGDHTKLYYGRREELEEQEIKKLLDQIAVLGSVDAGTEPK
jgi:hypothetical protein